MNLTLFLSDRCNMSCDYCFLKLNEGSARVLDRRAAEFAVREHALRQPNGRGSVTILGGEPFLHYPLLAWTVRMIRDRAPGASIQVVTNGALATAARIAELSQWGAEITVSLDGRAASHDRHRRLVGRPNASSAELTLSRLPAAERRRLKVNMVVGEDTAGSLLGNVEYLRGLGFEKLSYHLNVVEDWSDAGLATLRKSLDGFVRYCRLLDGRTRAGFTDFLTSGSGDRGHSGSGHAYDDLILGADGNYYPCDGLFARSYEDLSSWSVGNAREGVDWEKRSRFHRQALEFIHGVFDGKPHLNCPRESYFRAVSLGRDPAAAVRAYRRADVVVERMASRLSPRGGASRTMRARAA